jgi:hypothetical protein
MAPISSVFKNRIINGAMVIAQRGTTFSGLSDDGGQYTLDRWRWSENGTMDGAQSVTQDSSAPTGFNYSLKVQTTTAKAVGTSLSARVEQFIEGFNFADCGWGTANAKTVTLSFWVRSSLTGTFGGAFRNSADDRSYPFSYTISVADTWEYKTVTVAGDTTGTWVGATNGTGVRINFSLGAGTALSGTAGAWAAGGFQSVTGAVSVLGTLNATWYVTGCQLEVGTQATSFEYRQYQQELALCQRYCYVWGGDNSYQSIGYGLTDTANRGEANLQFPVSMRTAPSITFSSTASQFRVQAYNIAGGAVNAYAATGSLADGFSVLNARILFTVAAGISVAQPTQLSANNSTSPRITVSAEL